MKIKKLTHRGTLYAPPQTKRMRSGLSVLKPGESVGEHSTGKHEEILIILKGTALLLANGNKKKLRAGYVAYNPPHTIHNVTNCGAGILRYVYIVA
ncbi:MAG: cupin domain-containing protein [Patescibacteria group bacterium]|jgi:quercetin dioxygenase-like cupin family protein